MSKQYSRLHQITVLRASDAALTVDTNGTELTGERLKNQEHGFALLNVSAVGADADETYDVYIEGRDSASDTWTQLGVFNRTQPGGTGQAVLDLDELKSRMRYRLDVAGTTPSITFDLYIVAPGVYLPAAEIIVA